MHDPEIGELLIIPAEALERLAREGNGGTLIARMRDPNPVIEAETPLTVTCGLPHGYPNPTAKIILQPAQWNCWSRQWDAAPQAAEDRAVRHLPGVPSHRQEARIA